MNLPADIPSYLSSQGTLSEPQEGYSNSEAGSHQQLMPPLSNGYVHKGTDGGYLPFEFETENNSSLLHLQTKLDISVVSCQYLWRIFLVL